MAERAGRRDPDLRERARRAALRIVIFKERQGLAQKGVLVIAATRIGDDEDLGRLAEPAEGGRVDRRVLARHGHQRQDPGVRLDHHLALGDDGYGLAVLQGAQARGDVEQVSHWRSDRALGRRRAAPP